VVLCRRRAVRDGVAQRPDLAEASKCEFLLSDNFCSMDSPADPSGGRWLSPCFGAGASQRAGGPLAGPTTPADDGLS